MLRSASMRRLPASFSSAWLMRSSRFLVAERLLDEIHRAGLHRLDRHRTRSPWPVMKMIGRIEWRSFQLHLQFEPAHAGHCGCRAPGSRAGRRARRRGNPWPDSNTFDGQPHGLEQQPQRVAHRRIVVNHEQPWASVPSSRRHSPVVTAGDTGSVK